MFEPTLQEKYNKFQCSSIWIRKELNEIKKSLDFKPKLQVIHGDLNYKNLIFQDGKFKSFLDFQEFSWGCPTEDLIRLILTNAEQHNFFRKNYTLKILKIMMENTDFSKEEWLYGLNVFILTKYGRKLKKQNLVKMFSIYRCSFLYEEIRRAITLFFDTKKS